MRWPKKRERLPEVVAQALGAPTRHARAVATLEGGWFAVDRGGYVLVQAGGCVSVRGAWASLAGLVWDEGLGCVTVTFVDPARPPLTIEGAEAPSLELLTAARVWDDGEGVGAARQRWAALFTLGGGRADTAGGARAGVVAGSEGS